MAATEPRTKPSAEAQELVRLRALLELAAATIEMAIDGDWREATDLLMDLADRLRAELAP